MTEKNLWETVDAIASSVTADWNHTGRDHDQTIVELHVALAQLPHELADHLIERFDRRRSPAERHTSPPIDPDLTARVLEAARMIAALQPRTRAGLIEAGAMVRGGLKL